jgi:hypothetical protein
LETWHAQSARFWGFTTHAQRAKSDEYTSITLVMFSEMISGPLSDAS